MKVAELVEALSNYPPETEVVIMEGCGCCEHPEPLTTLAIETEVGVYLRDGHVIHPRALRLS